MTEESTNGSCALPGCGEAPSLSRMVQDGREGYSAYRVESGFYPYCSAKHMYYHERDKQTAAWLLGGGVDA